MPEDLAAGEQAPEKPKETEKAKAERIAKERELLLSDIAARLTGDLKRQVGYVLSHYPATRDSDVTLAIRLWQTFYDEYLDGDFVRLDQLYRLPRQTSISRVRAKIQNEYGLFQASPEVEQLRKSREEEVEEEVVADQPGPPIISVHSDESGKAERFVVVGSLWVIDVAREWRIVLHLKDWKKQHGILKELKFADLTPKNVETAKEFVKAALEYSHIMGFKACVVDKSKIKGGSVEETLYRLYYELAMSGVEHELRTGRVALPRWISLVKDADDAPDVLKLPEVRRKLTVECQQYFKGGVGVDDVVAGKSHESELLQLADLFSGSIARVLNKKGDKENQKDDFAHFFEQIAGFAFGQVPEGDLVSDFIYVRLIA